MLRAPLWLPSCKVWADRCRHSFRVRVQRLQRRCVVAKVPPGVGPRFPQVVVLVGATGDLARRKLLPGLFHLATAGFIPGCRIVGVSLDALDADGFRASARASLDEFATRKLGDAEWAAF